MIHTVSVLATWQSLSGRVLAINQTKRELVCAYGYWFAAMFWILLRMALASRTL